MIAINTNIDPFRDDGARMFNRRVITIEERRAFSRHNPDDPTPEEIAARTAEIRKTWSKKEERRRLVGGRDFYRADIVSVHEGTVRRSIVWQPIPFE